MEANNARTLIIPKTEGLSISRQPLKRCSWLSFYSLIALRLSLSADLPMNLFIYCTFLIGSDYYKYFIIVGTRMFISTGFAT